MAVTLTLTLDLQNLTKFICALNYIINQSLVKFRPQDIVLTERTLGRTHARKHVLTDGRPKNTVPSAHLSVGGGIKWVLRLRGACHRDVAAAAMSRQSHATIIVVASNFQLALMNW